MHPAADLPKCFHSGLINAVGVSSERTKACEHLAEQLGVEGEGFVVVAPHGSAQFVHGHGRGEEVDHHVGTLGVVVAEEITPSILQHLQQFVAHPLTTFASGIHVHHRVCGRI